MLSSHLPGQEAGTAARESRVAALGLTRATLLTRLGPPCLLGPPYLLGPPCMCSKLAVLLRTHRPKSRRLWPFVGGRVKLAPPLEPLRGAAPKR